MLELGHVAPDASSGVARAARNEAAGARGNACESGRWPRSPFASLRVAERTNASALHFRVFYSQELGHFFVEESFTWAIGLEPMTVDH
jgi:hypothetical protein